MKEMHPLSLVKEIPLPNVSGRIDHIAFNSEKQIAYVAALGNNSVEVVDLKNGVVLHSIKNLDEPQGIVFIPERNQIVVACGGDGKCLAFDASTFPQTHSLTLSGDADNVRYDSATGKLFVGYGNGGIAIIDATSFQQERNISLAGHPESFQLSKSENKIYVNVPDEHEVDVIDLKTSTVTAHYHPQSRSNFPMAIDEVSHKIFIGCRNPSRLEVLDSGDGTTIQSLTCVGDADDVFFDAMKRQILVTGGEGFIDVFAQGNGDRYELISRTATRSGARTSLLIPTLNQLIVASPSSSGKPASLLIYSTQ